MDAIDEVAVADVVAELWRVANERRPLSRGLPKRAPMALGGCLDALALDTLAGQR